MTAARRRDRAALVALLSASDRAAERVRIERHVAHTVSAARLARAVTPARATHVIATEEPSGTVAIRAAREARLGRGVLTGTRGSAELARSAAGAAAILLAVRRVGQTHVRVALGSDAAQLSEGPQRVTLTERDVAAIRTSGVALALDAACAIRAAERRRGAAALSATDRAARAGHRLAVTRDAIGGYGAALPHITATIAAPDTLLPRPARAAVPYIEATRTDRARQVAAFTRARTGCVTTHIVHTRQARRAQDTARRARITLLQRTADVIRLRLPGRTDAAAIRSTLLTFCSAVPRATAPLAFAVILANCTGGALDRRAAEADGSLRIAAKAIGAAVGTRFQHALPIDAADRSRALASDTVTLACHAAAAVRRADETRTANLPATDRYAARGWLAGTARTLRGGGTRDAVAQRAGTRRITIAARDRPKRRGATCTCRRALAITSTDPFAHRVRVIAARIIWRASHGLAARVGGGCLVAMAFRAALLASTIAGSVAANGAAGGPRHAVAL